MENTKLGLTVDDMWRVVCNLEDKQGGLPGYDIPKVYFDHKKNKYDRDTLQLHQKVWANKEHYPPAKYPLDKEGQKILPSKRNFIDEIIKNSKRNFSQKKFDDYNEKLKAQGVTLADVESIKSPKIVINNEKSRAHLYKADRRTNIGDIFIKEKKNSEYSDYVKEIIEKVKERHSKYSSPKKIILKPNLDKGDRITFVNDAEYVGQTIPFYNNEVKVEESTKPKVSEFFPEKLRVLSKSPVWKISKPVKVNHELQIKRSEIIQEKANQIRTSWEKRRIKFIDDVSLSYFQLSEGRKGSFKYGKEIVKPEQYITARTQKPLKSPGPQEYFKTPVFKLSLEKKNSKGISQEESPNIFYSDRSKTDKRVYKPLKSYIY